jgi:hypothetical protein
VAGEGLVAHWPFDGDALDVSGNDLHGSVAQVAPAPDRFGRPDRALAFDVSTVAVPHSALLDLDAGITVSLWVRADEIQSSGNRMVFGKSNYVTATNFLLRIRPGGFLQWEYFDYTESTEAPLQPGVWHHIAVTATGPGEDKRIYIDGVEVATSAPPGIAFGLVDAPLTFGFANYGAEHFTGRLDEVRLHARALSPAEILDLVLEDLIVFADGFEDP